MMLHHPIHCLGYKIDHHVMKVSKNSSTGIGHFPVLLLCYGYIHFTLKA